jgi:type I restriction enzyme S subunit
MAANAAVERSTSVFREVSGVCRAALRRAAALRRSILATAFSGQLVPQDPGDEPASVLLDRIRAERAGSTQPKGTRKVRAS